MIVYYKDSPLINLNLVKIITKDHKETPIGEEWMINLDEIVWSFEYEKERDEVYHLILVKHAQNIWELDGDNPGHAAMLPVRVDK